MDNTIFVKEPILGESIPNEFYNEESNNQIINEGGNVWLKEDFLTCNSIKTETSKGFNAENYSRVPIFFKLGVKNELNEMKVQEITEDSYLIREENNHEQNENIECTMSRVGDVNEMCSSIKQELIIMPEKCDLLTSMDSVKTETSEDINENEESEDIINQIIDENGQVLPKEDFSTSWNFHPSKMEDSEDFNIDTESTSSKGKKKDLSELLSSIPMERSPPKCKLPKNSKHSKRKNQKCHSCDYSSSQKGHLNAHIKAIHLKLKNHKCNYCDYSSSYKINLQNHMRAIHLKLKNHKCHLCNYSSCTRYGLQIHLKSVHLKLKTHKCNMCDYSSSDKTNLRRHIQAIHLKTKNQNHKCNICDYSSCRLSELQSHLKSVHLTLYNFKCNLCDYSSPLKGNLLRHINAVHSKLRNHKCNICDFSSSQRYSVQRHLIAVHYKLLNHKCNFCDYRSSHTDNLRKHINAIHLKLKKSLV